ncbi:MAG: GTP cyclohydrolase I FolE [Dehalococcoidales bacterium]|jgi:GTP cyclohydrolase I|nr:GTP cyclohydrolase I FolE [Dehalococcoidales bacterium]
MTKINKKIISDSISKIIDSLGDNVNKDGVKDTPQRVAKAYEELLSGYDADINKIINNALFKVKYDQIVTVKNIRFYSLCEHHLLPFFGTIHIGYLPKEKIIGLSKLPRIALMFAKRLQVQERLTEEIGKAIFESTDAKGAGVVITAQHLCSSMRGVNMPGTEMLTSALFGRFKSDSKTRKEFFDLIR